MTARIENVLAAKSPSLTDENDWEEFALTDVRVRFPGKTRYANLLSASPRNPVSVTGQLELVEENQECLVLDENYRSKRIIIENVTHYAYGQQNDGEIGIWVAGEPGWFYVTPARNYRQIYNEMVEAVDLLYFITDKHQQKGRRRKQWNPKVDYLLDQYVNHTHGACEDADDAIDVFDKHHAFLIKQMVHGEEGIDWSTTPIYKYFREKYEELFEQLEGLEDSDVGDNHSDVTEDEDAEDENPESPDAVTVEKAQADTIFETVLDMKELSRPSKQQLTLKSAAEYLTKRYEIDSLDYAVNLIKARAGHLIEMMDNAKSLSSIDWSRKTIYRQLKAAERSASTQEVHSAPLHPRPSGDQDSSSSSPEESEEEDQRRGPKRRARMSILRPKLSSGSANRAGKSGKQPPTETSDSEPEPENLEPCEETPTRFGGHRLIQEATPARVNGAARAVISVSESDSWSSKKASVQETIDLADAVSPPINGDFILPPSPPLQPDIDLPPDTWMCPVQGCGKTVYKASTKRSRDVIFDHSLVHADDTQTKLNLVFAEQRLNVNASVDYLLTKIRDFGALQEGSSDAIIDPDSKRAKLSK
ncbi:hypothetical protein PRK78_006499 [Emydomyces testavorans]|uniref:DNA (cytosine-5)-methyltransferase 1 replication foci domain-containing protein n=1 Tax=Emydomyces testavorans TaxID=2070801 RepID=A0AAF0DQC1_9EURO|nr:hypothetical protein PRK78_006499 [Emydomyces testavorans]